MPLLDYNALNLLIKEIALNADTILHFNWLEHLPAAFYIKQRVACKIVFTKHYVFWQNIISSHYSIFYEIRKFIEKNKPIPLYSYEILKKNYFLRDIIDHFITVTQYGKKSLLLSNIDANKITTIYNGLKILNKPNNKKTTLRKKYGFSADEKVILYVGNVIEKKGIFDIVKTIKKLRAHATNFRLVIAGPGNYEQLMGNAHEMCANIVLTGSLNKTILNDFYAMADIGILPSYVEQCSYTCIEMMQSGLPLLVSDVDGLGEIVNKECGLRIKVNFNKDGASLNQKDLIVKLSFLLNNPTVAKKLGANARKYALKYFSAQRMGKETIAIYKKVLTQSEVNSIAKNPLVSIILPVYNTEKYLNECLQSIFKQTYTNFELLIIDDGSTDGTVAIIEKYNDTRLVYLKNITNKGITYSLNKGIDKSNGKYIARIDADDLMMPERLQKQVAFMEQNKDYVMVGSGHYLIDDKGMPFNHFLPSQKHEELKLNLLFFNSFSHPTVMYKAKLAKQLLYSEKYKHCEDYELWFRMAAQGKVCNLPNVLVQYRVHATNTSMNNQKEMQQNVMKLISNQLDQLEIDYTAEELMLHCTFGFGIARQYFNSENRMMLLNNWLDKLFNAESVKQLYSSKSINSFKKKILANL